MSKRPFLVLVGGFLGAGKTTLIMAAARELARRGLRSGVILNDQGDELVDTQLVREAGLAAGEVTGGCFCCRFSDLIGQADALRSHNPDVIFAEPVGSCTDLAATTIQPIRQLHPNTFRLAPLTVLVDPERANQLMRGAPDPDMAFLFEHQLREADLVCFTKLDLGSDVPALPGLETRFLSAKTGQGVAAWLDEVLAGELSAGDRVLDIDYGRYAQAEASLAWLNLSATLTVEPSLTPAMVIGPFLDEIGSALTCAGIGIVHLKASNTATTGYLKAALCRSGEDPVVEGALDASPARRHFLLLNLRALGAATQVQEIVERQIQRLPGQLSELRISCFQPAAPQPEHRMGSEHLAK